MLRLFKYECLTVNPKLGIASLVMDWAVWDHTHDQVAQERSYVGHEWQCDFYFGYGLDVIEETALNEISCIQVLRTWITKENTEILELEEDLITLQSQLAWDDESWTETCSAALTEKIECLDNSIQSLKNTNAQDEHDFGVCLLLPRKPAEKMHEILKDLLQNYFHQKDEQVNVILEQISWLCYEISTIILKRKHANSIVKVSCIDLSTPAAGCTHGKKIFSKSDSARNKKAEARRYHLTPEDNFMNQKSSLKTTVRRKNHEEPNEESVNSVVPKEDLSFKTEKDEAGEGKHEKTIIEASNSDALVVNSSPKTTVKERKFPRTVKISSDMEEPASASSSDASEHAIGPNGKNKLCRIGSKVNLHKGIKEQKCTDQSIILKSSLHRGGRKSNISETVEPADYIVELRSSDFQAVNEESNVNVQSEGTDSDPTNKIHPLLSSLKIEKKRIKAPRRTKGQQAALTDTEQNAADTLLQLLNHKRECTGKRKLKEEQKPKTENDDESNSKLHLKPQKPRAKRVHQQKPEGKLELSAAKQGVASQSQKKRKSQSSPALEETKKLKSLEVSVVKLCPEKAETTSVEDLCASKRSFPLDPPNNGTPELLPPPPTLPPRVRSGLDSEHLSLVDLRAFAKQQNMKGYSKLKKAKLAEELGLKLMLRGGCT